MTVNSVYHQISNLNDKSLMGAQPALQQCYGQSESQLKFSRLSCFNYHVHAMISI